MQPRAVLIEQGIESQPGPSMPVAKIDSQKAITTRNIRGLALRIDEVLAMSFGVLALQETDIDEPSVGIIFEACRNTLPKIVVGFAMIWHDLVGSGWSAAVAGPG